MTGGAAQSVRPGRSLLSGRKRSSASAHHVTPRCGAGPRPPPPGKGPLREPGITALGPESLASPEGEDAKANLTPGIPRALPPGRKLNTRPHSARPAIAFLIWKALSPLRPEPQRPPALHSPYCVSWEHRIHKETLGTLAGSAACEAQREPLTCRPLAGAIRVHPHHHRGEKRCPALTGESGA